MGAAAWRDERISGPQYALTTVDNDVERARNHIGDLVVDIMGMGQANGTLVKLNQYRHQARRISHYFSANAVTQFVPIGRIGSKEIHVSTSVVWCYYTASNFFET